MEKNIKDVYVVGKQINYQEREINANMEKINMCVLSVLEIVYVNIKNDVADVGIVREQNSAYTVKINIIVKFVSEVKYVNI